MIPFAGWNMPVSYAGITQEHLAVRGHCGIFDISHMGEFVVSGPDAGDWLNRQLTNNTARLNPGQGQYSLLLNAGGGVIDDLILYRLNAETWFLVVNAGRIEADRASLTARLEPGITFRDESPAWAAMAVQGPESARHFTALTGLALPPRNGIAEHRDSTGRFLVCRTGYTGEDGFELFCPAAAGPAWWERFVVSGAVCCGLGARDTLRLEMGYPLNGSDLSPERTPLEAGLGAFVDMNKGEFTGRPALARQKEHGLPSRLTALRMTGKAPPPRAHYPVLHDGRPAGELCSGGVSPSLGTGIAMAYLTPELAVPGTRLAIEIRGTAWPAEVVTRPFYRRPAA